MSLLALSSRFILVESSLPRLADIAQVHRRAEPSSGAVVQTITVLSPIHVQLYAFENATIPIHNGVTLAINDAPTFIDTVLTGKLTQSNQSEVTDRNQILRQFTVLAMQIRRVQFFFQPAAIQVPQLL